MKTAWIIILGCWLAFTAKGQSLTIVDESGNPVSDAQVLYQKNGDWIFTISDSEGTVSLDEIESGAELRISLLGYEKSALVWEESIETVTLQKADYDLSEVVITGQYRPKKKNESVHSIRTIGADEIEDRAAVTLDDVLRNELNFRISRDNILGTGLAMQGISGENVKIMIDGVPVIGRLNGNIDLSQINLHQIERIEIVEGPLAVNYGSNALAGTINLITKSPKSEETNAEASFFTESIGHFNVNGTVSTGIKKQSITVSGGRNFFDGWSPGDDFFYHDPEPSPMDEERSSGIRENRSLLMQNTDWQPWEGISNLPVPTSMRKSSIAAHRWVPTESEPSTITTSRIDTTPL